MAEHTTTLYAYATVDVVITRLAKGFAIAAMEIGSRPLAPATIRQSWLMLTAMDSILLTALMACVLTSTVMAQGNKLAGRSSNQTMLSWSSIATAMGSLMTGRSYSAISPLNQHRRLASPATALVLLPSTIRLRKAATATQSSTVETPFLPRCGSGKIVITTLFQS